MYRFASRTAVLLLCATTATIASADPLADAEARIRDAWSKVDSISAKLTVEATVPTGANRLRLNGEGTLEYVKDGELGKYRQEVKVVMTDPQPIDMITTMIFDGKELYMTNTVGGTTTTVRDNAGADPMSPPPGGAPLLDTIKQVANLTLQDEETVDGKKRLVIVGRPKEGADIPAFARIVLHIDAETGLRVKTEFYESEELLTASVALSDIKLNEGVDAARFAAPASSSKIQVNPASAAPEAAAGSGTAGQPKP